jgi:hypothetical protein
MKTIGVTRNMKNSLPIPVFITEQDTLSTTTASGGGLQLIRSKRIAAYGWLTGQPGSSRLPPRVVLTVECFTWRTL